MAITAIVTWACEWCRWEIKGEPEEANVGWTEFVVDLPKGWHEIVIDPKVFGRHPCYNMMLVCENCFKMLRQQGHVIEDFWEKSE